VQVAGSHVDDLLIGDHSGETLAGLRKTYDIPDCSELVKEGDEATYCGKEIVRTKEGFRIKIELKSASCPYFRCPEQS
jgi:hypothetical protein